MADTLRTHRLRNAFLYFGAWTLLGAFFASQTVVYSLISGRPADWRRAFLYQLPDAWSWALLAIPAFWLARRYPFSAREWPSALAVHWPAALLMAAIEGMTSARVLMSAGLIGGGASNWTLMRIMIAKLHTNLATYALVVGAAHAFDWYRRMRDRELAASRLEASLSEARLEALKTQLQPHFLFNTLHAITALMHTDVERADMMMARLSDLLRQSMERVGRQEVTLREELEFLRGYLDIQQMRFGDRLRAHVHAVPEVLDAMVPALVLQPLVENAIRHGFGERVSGGRVEVLARRAQEKLRVEVRDDGAGLPEAGVREGTGLSNTRARLQQLYGPAQTLELEPTPGGGTRVRIELPLHLASEVGT
ncbi:MAG TPA: histidine kinase [Candidatus Sulfotelmatobacter sp.]|nr:histidine kinase [Candidatus Sulfotelmatobacter sp.]